MSIKKCRACHPYQTAISDRKNVSVSPGSQSFQFEAQKRIIVVLFQFLVAGDAPCFLQKAKIAERRAAT